MNSLRRHLVTVRRTEATQLRNQEKEVLHQVEALRRENAKLRRDVIGFDVALKKYERNESDAFSELTEKHEARKRQINEEIQKKGRKCLQLDHEIRATEEETNRLKDLIHAYERLRHKSKLQGTAELADRLKRSEDRTMETEYEIEASLIILIYYCAYSSVLSKH